MAFQPYADFSGFFFNRPLPVSANKSSPLRKNLRIVRKCMKELLRELSSDEDEQTTTKRNERLDRKTGVSTVLDHLITNMIAPLVEQAVLLGLHWKVGITISLKERIEEVKKLSCLPPGYSYQRLIDMGLARVFVIAIFPNGRCAQRAETCANTFFEEGAASVDGGSFCATTPADDLPRLLYFLDFHPAIFELEQLKTLPAGTSRRTFMNKLLDKVRADVGERMTRINSGTISLTNSNTINVGSDTAAAAAATSNNNIISATSDLNIYLRDGSESARLRLSTDAHYLLAHLPRGPSSSSFGANAAAKSVNSGTNNNRKRARTDDTEIETTTKLVRAVEELRKDQFPSQSVLDELSVLGGLEKTVGDDTAARVSHAYLLPVANRLCAARSDINSCPTVTPPLFAPGPERMKAEILEVMTALIDELTLDPQQQQHQWSNDDRRAASRISNLTPQQLAQVREALGDDDVQPQQVADKVWEALRDRRQHQQQLFEALGDGKEGRWKRQLEMEEHVRTHLFGDADADAGAEGDLAEDGAPSSSSASSSSSSHSEQDDDADDDADDDDDDDDDGAETSSSSSASSSSTVQQGGRLGQEWPLAELRLEGQGVLLHWRLLWMHLRARP